MTYGELHISSGISGIGGARELKKRSYGMHITHSNVYAIVSLCCQLLTGSAALAQDTPSVFERCLDYAMEFDELDNLHTLYMTSTEKLSSERMDGLKRLAETNQTIAQLIDRQAMQRLTALEGRLLAVEQQSALNIGFTSSDDPQINRVSTVGAGRQLMQTQVQLDMLYHQMKTTDEAGRLVLERRKSLIEELQSIATELDALNAKALELFDRYWEQADVAAVKSDLELRAGLRGLMPSPSDNYGAMFAHAITLMRLRDFDKALSLLNQLVQVPAARGVGLAARAELYVRMGKPDLSAADMRQALSIAKNDPRVRMHCAMTHSAAGNMKSAEAEWEAVLKLGSQEVAARRAIALINASAPNLTNHNRTKATECAELAAKLAGEDNWACTMALALAAHANGQTDEAISSAERASEVAIGEKRIYCEAILEQIQAGSRVYWQF